MREKIHVADHQEDFSIRAPETSRNLGKMYQELELESFNLSEESERARLSQLLKNMNGVHAARISRGGVHIMFNPRGIAAQEIAATVKRAGFCVGYEQHSSPSTPPR